MTASTGPLTCTKFVTSCSTKTKPFSPNRWEMLSTLPVSRLSMATTSSPRPTSVSQMCEPRKPAPPVTTMRATGSAPPDGVVGEATPADGRRVEQVAGVDQSPFGHEATDLLEVEPAELVPLGEHDEHRCALARGVGIGCHLEAVDRASYCGVVGPQAGAALLQLVH